MFIFNKEMAELLRKMDIIVDIAQIFTKIGWCFWKRR